MNPMLMMLLQVLMQGQQNQPGPPMPPMNPQMGPMETPAPMTNFPVADPTAGVPNYQALAKSYLSGRNI